MKLIRRLSSALLCLALSALPASAHLLKVFATVEDGTVTGYGFFVGGGRPQSADVIMRGADGKDLWRGHTDDRGRFSWKPDKPTALTVIIDARDGHIAEAKIAANRFAGAEAPANPGETTAATGQADGAPTGGTTSGCAAGSDTTALATLVDKAVARQVRPLLEAYEGASAGVRFNDIMGGIGMIVGLAGLGMWAVSRRKNG